MIPYEELAAALQRWRLRNGLPVADVAVASAPPPPPPPAPTAPVAAGSFAAAGSRERSGSFAAAGVSSGVPVAAPSAPTTRSTRHPAPSAPASWGAPAAPPAAPARGAPARGAPAPGAMDVDIGDVDVIDEDLYATNGGDFAVSFNGRNGRYDEEGGERTAIGNVPGGQPPPFYENGQDPSYGGGRASTFDDEFAVEAIDADGEILEEADEQPPRRR